MAKLSENFTFYSTLAEARSENFFHKNKVKMVETKSSADQILSMEQKRNGFHAKYLHVCKSKNLAPVPEVKNKQRNVHVLDFHADRVRFNDWMAICEALHGDTTLKFIAIRLRKNNELGKLARS